MSPQHGLYLVYGHCDSEHMRFGRHDCWTYSIQDVSPTDAEYARTIRRYLEHLDSVLLGFREGFGGRNLFRVFIVEVKVTPSIHILWMLDMYDETRGQIWPLTVVDPEKFRALFGGAPLTNHQTEIILCQTLKDNLIPS